MTIIDRYVHGTFTAYQSRGCRCERCTAFMSAYLADRREAVAGTLNPRKTSDPRHGTLNGYNYYRCRCERCVEASREYHAARRAKRRQVTP